MDFIYRKCASTVLFGATQIHSYMRMATLVGAPRSRDTSWIKKSYLPPPTIL